VWCLVGDRPGDNKQSEALTEALGWPAEPRYVRVQDRFARSKPRVVPSLHHLDPDQSDPLEAPWPDLVVTMGRRLSMVALWIAEQSGGRTRTVLLGKPSGLLDHFDLVVPSAENVLPRRPNVHPTRLPLTRVDAAALERARDAWSAPLGALPRPLTALLVGGPTKPFCFDAAAASELAQRAAGVADGGTLYACTSPRTTPEIVAALEAELPESAILHRFDGNAERNPYLGLLAHADRFIVTADSISMLVEVARLGRPLAVAPLAMERPWWGGRLARWLASHLLSSTAPGGEAGLTEPLGYALYRRGWIRHARDFGAIHRTLLEGGLAVELGEPFPPAGRAAPDERPDVVARVRSLLGAR